MDLTEKLARERRARLAAERLLEQKQRELFAANEKLALHARGLSDQIVEQRSVVREAVSEAEALNYIAEHQDRPSGRGADSCNRRNSQIRL